MKSRGGTHFLVLELIDGGTLSERLKGGPIPVEEALKLALQIAEALEAAREKGVIHRDLKPANIKVTPDSRVKVLDFGLAKAYAGESADVNLSNSPTLSDAATQQGVILGTAAYMPPEQAKGKPVDKRADIWAFGIVLFEMLTGRQLFTGDTVSETLASVIKSEPEWESLSPNLHPGIRILLERCLEKDPRDRYGAISDARVDIQKVLNDPGGVFVQATTTEPQTGARSRIRWIAAVIFVAIIAGLAGLYLKAPEPRRVMRFEYQLPEGQQFSSFAMPVFNVSPDGRQIVSGETKGLYLRSVDELEARLIPGTEGSPIQPFFSPDGKWIGYYAGAQLMKISVNGGAPVVLCTALTMYGTSWYSDDTIVYGTDGGIMRISADGGEPEFMIEDVGMSFGDPQILPDGKSVLFTDINSRPRKVVVQSIKSGERK